MWFSAVLLLAVGAVAQVGPVETALAQIQVATNKINTQIQNFSINAILPLEEASSDTIDLIKASNERCKNLTEISVVDALTLQQPIADLSATVKTTMTNLIDKKAAFVNLGVGDIVYIQLVQLKAASVAFSDTVTAKINLSVRRVANFLVQPLQDELQKGIDAFADQANGNNKTALNAAAGPVAASGYSLAAIAALGVVAVL